MSTPIKDKMAGCDPALIRKVEAIVDDLKGHGMIAVVTEGKRTLARQAFLWSQGRTRPGKIVTWTMKSNHLSGRAADLAFVVNGRITWDVPPAWWEILGKAARAHGLTWGGDFKKNKDRPHVELP